MARSYGKHEMNPQITVEIFTRLPCWKKKSNIFFLACCSDKGCVFLNWLSPQKRSSIDVDMFPQHKEWKWLCCPSKRNVNRIPESGNPSDDCIWMGNKCWFIVNHAFFISLPYFCYHSNSIVSTAHKQEKLHGLHTWAWLSQDKIRLNKRNLHVAILFPDGEKCAESTALPCSSLLILNPSFNFLTSQTFAVASVELVTINHEFRLRSMVLILLSWILRRLVNFFCLLSSIVKNPLSAPTYKEFTLQEQIALQESSSEKYFKSNIEVSTSNCFTVPS